MDEKPTEEYSDIGGLDKQIQELVEAIVIPMTHRDRFDKIGIRPPKGCLMYGPPGTGKTLMARACAAQVNRKEEEGKEEEGKEEEEKEEEEEEERNEQY